MQWVDGWTVTMVTHCAQLLDILVEELKTALILKEFEKAKLLVCLYRSTQ